MKQEQLADEAIIANEARAVSLKIRYFAYFTLDPKPVFQFIKIASYFSKNCLFFKQNFLFSLAKNSFFLLAKITFYFSKNYFFLQQNLPFNLFFQQNKTRLSHSLRKNASFFSKTCPLIFFKNGLSWNKKLPFTLAKIAFTFSENCCFLQQKIVLFFTYK